MLSEPENSRFSYWLAAALAVALIAGWFVLNRSDEPLAPAASTRSTDPTPTTSTATPGAAPELPPKPPRRFGGAAAPSSPGAAKNPSPPQPATAPAANRTGGLVRGSALLIELNQALARGGHPSANHVTKDLLALFQLHPVNAVPANASASEIGTAIAQRKDANESILAMSAALLNPAQLTVFRAQLEGELRSLEARRRDL